MSVISDFRNQRPAFADYLPYAAMVDPGIILNKDGSLMAAWEFKGPDVQSSTPLERNVLSARINAVLRRLGGGYMIHVDAVRRDSRGYPKASRSHFPDRITRAIDAERRASFEAHKAHFETVMILTVTYMPTEFSNSKFVNAMYSQEGAVQNTVADNALSDFKLALVEFEDLLDNVMLVTRLKADEIVTEAGRTLRPDNFLRHIQHCISGHDHPVNLPDVPMYLDAVLGAEFTPAITPKVDDKFIGCVTIEGFPQDAFPGILSELDALPLEYRWSTRFIFLDPTEAKSKLESYRKKWKGSTRSLVDQIFNINSKAQDGDAHEMVSDTEEALTEAGSQLVTYGYYTANIVIYHDRRDQLERHLAFVRRVVNNAGFVARIETVNAIEAYLGTLPGNGYPNIRDPLMHSFNLSDLIPLNSVWAGREINPCPFYPKDAPPLMQVATAGSTPFRLNLHVGDVGHTMVFGPTGSGKSTLLSLIAAQFRRYRDAQIFAFDKGRSILPLTLASGGKFYDIGGTKSDLYFCPLAQVDNDLQQSWAEDWITTILALQNVTITPEDRNEIHRAMTLIRNSKSDKTLSNFITNLQNKKLRAALHYYSVDGTLGHLLDSDVDTLEDSAFTAFEMDDLMEMGEQALMPVLLYLFNRIERRLTGKPSLIILDEAWVMLGHDVFRAKIREWLKVLRRNNCAVVLATQSLSDAQNSGIMDVLTESCKTKIILPNPEAQEPNSRAFYEIIGLNERQIEIISTATPKREYYIMSPEGRRLFDMELGPLALSFVGVSGAEDIARIRELYEQHGDAWPESWLDERGVTYDH